jgi:hypothetical protein
MDPARRVVTRLPLETLFTEAGPLKGRRQRDIGLADLVELVRLAPLLVIAEVGRPLSWIPRQHTFDVWKKELRARIVEPGTSFRLEDFPGAYCFRASEWTVEEAAAVLVFERMH